MNKKTVTFKRSLKLLCVAGLLAAVVAPSAQASRYDAQRIAAINSAAIATIRNAETALNTYYNLNNESFGGSRFPLARAMSSASAPGREKGLIWRVAGRNHVVHNSGRRNNPKTVFIYDIKRGRFGGVLACVGSRGTKNYCEAILGNDATQHYTIFKKKGHSNGIANKHGAKGYGGLVTGDASTPASFVAPTFVRGKWRSGWLS